MDRVRPFKRPKLAASRFKGHARLQLSAASKLEWCTLLLIKLGMKLSRPVTRKKRGEAGNLSFAQIWRQFNLIFFHIPYTLDKMDDPNADTEW